MTTMISELFDDLRTAHIPEEKARAAAETVAAMPEARLAAIEGGLAIYHPALQYPVMCGGLNPISRSRTS